jgi:hypothetical protein
VCCRQLPGEINAIVESIKGHNFPAGKNISNFNMLIEQVGTKKDAI